MRNWKRQRTRKVMVRNRTPLLQASTGNMVEEWYGRGLTTVPVTRVNFLTILPSPGKREMRLTVQQHLWLSNSGKKKDFWKLCHHKCLIFLLQSCLLLFLWSETRTPLLFLIRVWRCISTCLGSFQVHKERMPGS